MIRGFWVPTNWKRAVLLLVLLALVLLRQSEIVGLMGSTTLVFGWLPAQIAYDIGIGLVATLLAYGLYREAPEPPAKYEPSVGTGGTETGETTTERGS